MSPTPDPDILPRILCLHGGGTSALIFRIQLRHLARALAPHFKLVYLDAPLVSPPGPNVLPAFADCAPYHRWMPLDTETGYDRLACAEQVRERIVQVVREEGGPEKFVGLMGFSQGGRQAAGLCADMFDLDRQGGGEGGGKKWEGLMPSWRFGVFLCASYPPYSLAAAKDKERYYVDEEWGDRYEVDSHGPVYVPGKEEVMAGLPTVHVRGLLDVHLEKGRRLAGYFGEAGRRELEYVMGHHMPLAAGDTTSKKGATEEIRDAILEAWELGRREEGEGGLNGGGPWGGDEMR